MKIGEFTYDEKRNTLTRIKQNENFAETFVEELNIEEAKNGNTTRT